MAIYFYKTTGKYGCFSNFYKCNFVKYDTVFTSSEQYFMFHKALYFNDEEISKLILKNDNPVIIKSLGRKIKNYNDNEWNKIRFDVMYNALLLKFSQNENIKKILLDTNDEMIYECSPTDNIWGIGISIDEAKNTNSSLYGKNLLGKALIKVRNELKK